jgi:type II secretory pathway predicted ATPase ExeA
MNQDLLALYGLKWNPFSSGVPTEALYPSPAFNTFCWRVEHTLIREGGFALIGGEPGTGKSVALRLLAHHLKGLRDIGVGVITLPSARMADFYREMGDVFGVELSPHNRWGGFKRLRERWLAHLEGTLSRPVLLIDEAQEVQPAVLNELRLLSSVDFDSRHLLSVVLAGDKRLTQKLRQDDLQPLGSRIRTRLTMEYAAPEELMACLQHLLDAAGNASLMSDTLKQTLCEHALGNYRILVGLAAELLATAAEKQLPHLDDKLYLQCFGSTTPTAKQQVR